MNDDEHRMLKESHELAREARKSSKRVEEYLFGKDDEVSKKPTRADMLDSIIFGVKAGKLGYRVTLGCAALFVAIGTVWATIKGWKM